MSRIQSGNFEYAPETVDAAALVRACCDLMRLKAEAAGVRLVRPLDERPVEIVADPRACRQVLNEFGCEYVVVDEEEAVTDTEAVTDEDDDGSASSAAAPERRRRAAPQRRVVKSSYMTRG